MSDPIVLKHPSARIDLAAHYGYIGGRDPGAAHRFRLYAEATFASLARSPGMGAPYAIDNPRLVGLRCFRINRFRNYLVFYLPIENGIDVIRVLHAARDLPNLLKQSDL